MVRKSIFMASLAWVVGMSNQCHALNHVAKLAPECGEIKDAAFYIIHGFKNLTRTSIAANNKLRHAYANSPTLTIYEGSFCLRAASGSFPKRHQCSEVDFIDHNQGLLTVTFYDVNRKIVAWIDVSKASPQKSATSKSNLNVVSKDYSLVDYRSLRNSELTSLHQYCQAKLDPNIAALVSFDDTADYAEPANDGNGTCALF